MPVRGLRTVEPKHRTRRDRQLIWALVGLAGVAALLLAVVWQFAVHSVRGQQIEDAAIQAVTTGQYRAWANDSLRSLANGSLLVSFIVVAVVVVIMTALQRRTLLGLTLVGLLVASMVTTELLKEVFLSRPDLVQASGALARNSFPSGHATAATALAVAFVVALPGRWRPTAAIPAALYSGVRGWQTVAAGWHRGSDVVAGVLVVVFWTCLLSAGLVGLEGARRARVPGPVARFGTVLAGVLLAIGVLGLAAVTWELVDLWHRAAPRPWAGAFVADASTVSKQVGALSGAVAVLAIGLGLQAVSFDPPPPSRRRDRSPQPVTAGRRGVG